MRVHQKELKWLSYKNKKKIEMGESTPKRIGVAELRTKRKKEGNGWEVTKRTK